MMLRLPWQRALGLIRDLRPPTREARQLMPPDLINTIGTGVYTCGGALYLVRVAGLSAAQVGVGLAIGGVFSLGAGLPLGHLTDRLGPRGVSAALFLVRAMSVAMLLLVRREWQLALVAAALLTAERGLQASFGALVAQVGGASRTQVQAYLRAITNVGVTVGALLAAPLLALNSAAAYEGLIVFDAILLGAAGVVLRFTASPAATETSAHPVGTIALTDVPFLEVALLDGALGMQYEVLAFALPLWIVQSTALGGWAVGPLLAINTVTVILCQVRVSSRVRGPMVAARYSSAAGLLFLVSCGLIGVAGLGGVALALVALVVAVVIHSAGELLQASASFTYVYDLADERAHGQYQAVFSMMSGVQSALGPALLGAVCLSGGWLGFVGLGCGLCAVGMLMPRVVRRAVASRPAGAVLTSAA